MRNSPQHSKAFFQLQATRHFMSIEITLSTAEKLNYNFISLRDVEDNFKLQVKHRFLVRGTMSCNLTQFRLRKKKEFNFKLRIREISLHRLCVL